MPLATSYIPANTTDSIVATSLANYSRKLRDNIFELSILFNKLKERGQVEFRDGGASIREHIMYQKSTDAGFYTGEGNLSTTNQQGLRSSEEQWRQAYASVLISGLEERQNAGRNAMIRLLKAKTTQQQNSLLDVLGDALFAASRDTNAMNTLVTVIDATSTIMGINSGNESFWQATETTSGSAAAQLITDMRTIVNTLTINGRSPQMGATTRAVLGYYEGLLQPQQRYANTTMANAGFTNLLYKDIPIFFDPKCNSGVLYFINLDGMKLIIDSGRNFVASPWIKPLNQDVKGMQTLVHLNIVVTERRLLGKLKSISA